MGNPSYQAVFYKTPPYMMGFPSAADYIIFLFCFYVKLYIDFCIFVLLIYDV